MPQFAAEPKKLVIKDGIGRIIKAMKTKLSGTSNSDLEEKLRVATEELRVERDRAQVKLQSSLESINVGFVITDSKGSIVEINTAAKRIICLPQDPQSRGVISLSSLSEDALAQCNVEKIQATLSGIINFEETIQKCIRQKKPFEFKAIQLGSRFLHLYFSPMLMVETEITVIGSVILIEDETEERVLSRSKDEFFSIASHELRTPLTSIRGNAAMIRDYYYDKLPDNEVKEMVSDIYDSSVRLIGIVNDFLNVSRLEQGKIAFKNESFDLIALIESTIQEFDTTVQEKKIYIRFDKPIDFSELKITADPDRTKEILINLIGNGLKFTQEGGITITLATDEKEVKVIVSDTGRGIALANQPLLFRKFQQAGSSLFTRDTTKGTGLGLYISKMMVEGMGGTITLEHSEEGMGSIFSFTLPLNASLKSA